MKRTPAQRMKTRRDRYVVGYLGPYNIVFGRIVKNGYEFKDAARPYTLRMARRAAATFPSCGAAIFELVPIGVNR